MDDYERVLLVKPEVQVYRIPPRTTNRAYRASDWNLDTPDWTCRLRLIAKGSNVFIKLDEKSTGQFFGQCPIDNYPGMAIEAVSDSSRYFVLKLVNEESGRTAFVGIGFVDRSDSFDLNVALQDHFKIVQMENDSTDNKSEDNQPKLNLSFKEGQTIKVNLNIGKSGDNTNKPRQKVNRPLNGVRLALPPGTKTKVLPQPTSSPVTTIKVDQQQHSNKTSESSFNQQLIEGLESLSVSNKQSNNGSSIDSLTPKNSLNSNDDLFTTNFDSVDFSASTCNTNSNVTHSSINKSDDDLWSEFESFRSNENKSDSKKPSMTATSFDNWAKFQ